MKRPLFLNPGKFTLILTVAMMSAVSAFAQEHPAYLHALSDLRAARWLIDHRPGNWQQNADEAAAVHAIDDAINEIKHAAIDDHKDINDHPGVQDIQDRAGRIQKALDMLRATRNDINQREDDRWAQGLKARALRHVDEAINAAQRAVAAGHQGAHPAYLQALSDLRVARWMFTNRPGNWQQTVDEIHAIQAIEAAISEIQKAAIDDGKNINDHAPVQEIQDRAGRIQKAIDMLNATRNDVNQREDDGYAQGLKGRALQHIDEAIKDARQAISAGHQGAHPAYLQALSDLRVARWMFTNRPANWQQTVDEVHAIQAIEAAIAEIQKAAIDDGKNINDHAPIQEIPDRAGRINKAIDLLNATRNDVNQREDDGFAQGLKSRALQHIDEAIRDARQALSAPTLGAHPAYMQALSDLRVARYMIDHRPGGWQQSPFEANAIREIDAAMNEIRKAAIDDGKNVNDHAPVDEISDRGGRMHKAMDVLRNTRRDVNQKEDDGYAQGLKSRALQHIDAALNFCQQAINNY